MILTLNAFSYKLKVQHQKNKKAYAIDTGLRNSVSFNLSEDLGRLYENIVFIELKRRNQDVYYWKNNYEIDFIIKKGLKISELIQVCHTPENDTKKRETKALLKGMEFFKLKNSIVITEDYEAREKIQNKTIKFIPLWKWLLHSNLKPIIF